MDEIGKLKQALKDLNLEATKIKDLPPEKRAEFGKNLNAKKQEILAKIQAAEAALLDAEVEPLDITAFSAVNEPMPDFYPAKLGSTHPLMSELDRVLEIYQMMGFEAVESVQLDDEFHMFDSLNFPKGHPARDGYDTFRTREGLIPPAQTSTMHRRGRAWASLSQRRCRRHPRAHFLSVRGRLCFQILHPRRHARHSP